MLFSNCISNIYADKLDIFRPHSQPHSQQQSQPHSSQCRTDDNTHTHPPPAPNPPSRRQTANTLTSHTERCFNIPPWKILWKLLARPRGPGGSMKYQFLYSNVEVTVDRYTEYIYIYIIQPRTDFTKQISGFHSTSQRADLMVLESHKPPAYVVYFYIYIYTYINTYIYIYTYIYMYKTGRQLGWWNSPSHPILSSPLSPSPPVLPFLIWVSCFSYTSLTYLVE